VTQIYKKPQIQMRKTVEQKQQQKAQMENPHSTYDKYKDIPEAAMKVAEGMETQFTNHLLAEIQKSSGQKLGGTQKIYRSMLDSERAKMMAQSATGLGIKDVVLKEFYPNFDQPKRDDGVKIYKRVNSHKGETNE